jgi:polar amino acid transport system substrate-binding protein
VEGALTEVRQCRVGDTEVVLHEVALRESALWEEDLVRVRYLDLVTADLHGTKYLRGRVALVRRVPVIVLVAVLAVLAAGCGGSSNKSSAGGTISTAAASCAKADLDLVNAGQLTVGTDNPAYPPWFGGAEKKPWKVSNPYSGKGYESAVAYAIANKLGFAKNEVTWIVVPFNTAFAPGPKKFDFDINQIEVKPVRAKAVDFSTSYYDVSQSLVVRKGTKIADARSIADLKPYKLGVQLGTTSYDTITRQIKPDKKPAVYDTNDAAVQALKVNQIDGLVVDFPTALYVTAVQVPNSEILGKFENLPGAGHFGVVLAKGSSLTRCVDKAILELRANGTLAKLQQQWLSAASGGRTLK